MKYKEPSGSFFIWRSKLIEIKKCKELFDRDQLELDFKKIKEVYPEKDSFMLTFINKECAGVMDNLHDRKYLVKIYDKEIWKMPPEEVFKYNHNQLHMDNFHSFMVGTYTHRILLEMDEKFRKEGKRISYVEYHELIPWKCYPIHADIAIFNPHRFHIPITTNPRALFLVEREKDNDEFDVMRMSDEGQLYMLKTDTNHTALNGGFSTRTHLMFDTVPIEQV